MNNNHTVSVLNKIFKIPIESNVNINLVKGIFMKISKVVVPINHKYTERKDMECLITSSHYNLIPIEIRENIDEKCFSHRLYNFVLNSGRSIQLFIIYENRDIKQLNDLFYKIYIWLYVIDDISPKKCSKRLTIYLFLSHFTKLLPTKKNYELDENHVNSAFTFSCKSDNEIYIYRLEECFKVFVHESFHSFGLDFSGINTNQNIITNNFKSLNINRDYRVYESYCETWAEIINILMIVSYHEQIKDFKVAMPIINNFIYYETLWSLFQCCKVLCYYGIQYDDLFNNKMKYIENKTHVFSYYILKTINLVNINHFFVWCRNNNSSIINFNQNPATVYEYYTFITKHSKNKELMKGLGIVKLWFGNQTTISKSDFVNKTLRMSLFG